MICIHGIIMTFRSLARSLGLSPRYITIRGLCNKAIHTLERHGLATSYHDIKVPSAPLISSILDFIDWSALHLGH
jgi:hypothetical protein